MKTKSLFLPLFFSLIFCGLSFHETQAQIFDKIKKEVKRRAENKVVNKAGNTTDKVIDDVTTVKSGSTTTSSGPTSSSSKNDTNGPVTKNDNPKPKGNDNSYKNYDFVPGDKILFQPDMTDEPDAELPARYVLKKGVSEIQSYRGEKILHINKGGNNIIYPLINKENYLPEQFTIEFDMMYENEASYFQYTNSFIVQFNSSDDNNFDGEGLYRFDIHSNTHASLGPRNVGRMAVPDNVKERLNTNDQWHHIALYFRKNIGKAYIDGTRVIATNSLPVGAAKFAIITDGRYGYKIKNMRVAAGGDDKYKKVVTDGKFITHGIQFDVNKSTIKPESMGTLNEIVKLMKDHDDLKFEINGHTDSDGKADANVKLSEARASSVKEKLVEMGIAENRLTTKGNGASKPIDTNDTQEGKANNRRVEFVKI